MFKLRKIKNQCKQSYHVILCNFEDKLVGVEKSDLTKRDKFTLSLKTRRPSFEFALVFKMPSSLRSSSQKARVTLLTFEDHMTMDSNARIVSWLLR